MPISPCASQRPTNAIIFASPTHQIDAFVDPALAVELAAGEEVGDPGQAVLALLPRRRLREHRGRGRRRGHRDAVGPRRAVRVAALRMLRPRRRVALAEPVRTRAAGGHRDEVRQSTTVAEARSEAALAKRRDGQLSRRVGWRRGPLVGRRRQASGLRCERGAADSVRARAQSGVVAMRQQRARACIGRKSTGREIIIDVRAQRGPRSKARRVAARIR